MVRLLWSLLLIESEMSKVPPGENLRTRGFPKSEVIISIINGNAWIILDRWALSKKQHNNNYQQKEKDSDVSHLIQSNNCIWEINGLYGELTECL